MPLPETILVKYTEEEAEYLSLRPVLRQTFRLHELLDMIVSVTGKDAERVRQILRGGTVVFHSYRYWWDVINAGAAELSESLATFPDPWPERPFRADQCTLILLEGTGGRIALEVEKKIAARRRLLRPRSLWDCLLAAASPSLRYEQYSYERHADQYAVALDPGQWKLLQAEVIALAPHALRHPLASLASVQRILYLCPRRG